MSVANSCNFVATAAKVVPWLPIRVSRSFWISETMCWVTCVLVQLRDICRNMLAYQGQVTRCRNVFGYRFLATQIVVCMCIHTSVCMCMSVSSEFLSAYLDNNLDWRRPLNSCTGWFPFRPKNCLCVEPHLSPFLMGEMYSLGETMGFWNTSAWI